MDPNLFGSEGHRRNWKCGRTVACILVILRHGCQVKLIMEIRRYFLLSWGCAVFLAIVLLWRQQKHSGKLLELQTEPRRNHLCNEGCKSNGLRIALVQLSTSKAHFYATHAQAINLMYARRHSYSFFSQPCPPFINESFMWDPKDQARANWAKPLFLLEHMKNHDYVLMLDGDAFISNPSITIEEKINEHMNEEDISVVMPRNCMVGEDRSPDSYVCWNDLPDVFALNLGVILIKSDQHASKILTEWYKSVEIECKRFVYPNWKDRWSANDQMCVSLLYKTRPLFQKHIKVLDYWDTKYFSGGGDKAWITHYLGGNRNTVQIGSKIQSVAAKAISQETYSLRSTLEWVKRRDPVFGGGDLGTCFDLCILRKSRDFNKTFSMYFSWRQKRAIGFTLSDDGISWDKPRILFQGIDASKWEVDINRPMILKVNGGYRMWYTGQTADTSMIGYAESLDGAKWSRHTSPVLKPSFQWEGSSIMCSHVIFDKRRKLYQMWYSAGHQIEPFAIGHATSVDGINWKKTSDAPIFTANATSSWESSRVSCPTVIYNGEFYYMFYIGFRNLNNAAIGIARSSDGVTNFVRHPHNPILSSTPGTWDSEAVYKPYPVYDGSKWILWYNGRNGPLEQIGMATLGSHDFGF